jgi:tetratricopeptide (TPR) repeat protein
VVDRALASMDPQSPAAAPLWQQRGWALYLCGSTTEAIPPLEQAILLAQPDDPVLPKALQVAASACASEARPEDGLQYALFARYLLERSGDLRELCGVLRVAGEVYYGLERFDEAAAALRQALVLAQRTGDAQEVGGVLINLGMVELARDHLDDAVDCDRRAAAQFERIDNRTGQAIAYANIAEKLLYSGDLSGAEEYCALATAKAADVGYRHTIADATATLALIRERQGDRDAARELATVAAEGFREIGAERDAQRADGIVARAGPPVPNARQ